MDGLLVLLNTVGGDIEAGLGCRRLIALHVKPTVSWCWGRALHRRASGSVGQEVFIAPSALATIHPVRLERPGDRGIPDLQLLCAHPGADYSVCHPEQPCKKQEDFTRLMLQTGSWRGCWQRDSTGRRRCAWD